MADINSILELQKLKVPDLKKMLKDKGLSTVGNKSELIERLQGRTANEELDSSGKDLLLEDDDDLQENVVAVKPLPAVTERKLTKPTATAPALKVKPVQPAAAEIKVTKPVLNKITMSSSNGAPAVATNGGKMEQRLKRFGVVSEVAKKTAREERFQLLKPVTATTDSVTPAAKTPTAITPPALSGTTLQKRIDRFGTVKPGTNSTKPDVDLLKKRAERFGSVTSTSLVKVGEQERVLKRKERFGTVISSSVSPDAPEAKKRRAERFGLPTA